MLSPWRFWRQGLHGGFCFQVIVFRVDRPDVGFVGDAGEQIIHGGHGSEHRMVHIVVLMHTVAANQKKVLELVKEFAQLGKRT